MYQHQDGSQNEIRCVVDPPVQKLLMTSPAYTTFTDLGCAARSEKIVAFVGLPLLHCMSNLNPPRMRAPVIDPDDHLLGSAGNRVTVRSLE